ncbi:MAG: glycosyltransferase family 1 protein [Phycisphaerales bacterium]
MIPATSMAPHTGPARIAWFAPGMIEGSGGLRTIVQNAEALTARGHACDLYVDHRPAPGTDPAAADEAVRDEVRRLFGYDRPAVYAGFGLRAGYDLAFATAWWTAPIVAALPPGVRKAYFVQDFEAYFNPMGDGFLLAENSYRLGLTAVTIGRWLTRKLTGEFGGRATWFEFGADRAVYRRVPGVPRERAVCFIHQPEKPRRCPRLGLMALEIVKRRRPGVTVYLYGSRDGPSRPMFRDLGLLGVEECNALYNRCGVGLCISSSNPSRIPFEMMAAGLPVVDVHRENNLYDMPPDAILLAEQTPESIAAAVIEVLDRRERAEAMARAGTRFMADRGLERGYAEFSAAVEDILAGTTDHWASRAVSIAPLYDAPARRDGHRPSPSPADGRTLADECAACDDDHATALARAEVASIERSRAWRLVQSIRRSVFYRAYAQARFGAGWDLPDPSEDPRQRLDRITRSRLYRLIHSMKRTGVYRVYARRGGRGPGARAPERTAP